jgi:endonuclease III
MSKASQRDLARAVLERYGTSYAEDAGIRLKNTPAPLFQLLNAAILMSARISAANAVEAAAALVKAKLTTPQKMAEATWQDRVDVLTANGYKRYDESTSTMLGETAEMLLDRYDGDLRQLRDEADRDVAEEHKSLQKFKGIGKVGADIFLREVQLVWDEAYPYADQRVTAAAKKLGLSAEASKMSRLVNKNEFPRLAASLVKVDLDDAYQEIPQQS